MEANLICSKPPNIINHVKDHLMGVTIVYNIYTCSDAQAVCIVAGHSPIESNIPSFVFRESSIRSHHHHHRGQWASNLTNLIVTSDAMYSDAEYISYCFDRCHYTLFTIHVIRSSEKIRLSVCSKERKRERDTCVCV